MAKDASEDSAHADSPSGPVPEPPDAGSGHDETPPAPSADPDAASAGEVGADTESVPQPAATGARRMLPRRRVRHARRGSRPKRKAPLWELPLLIVVAVGIAILVKSFVVQPFYIPSASMEHTLHGCPGCSGDRILVNKVIYDFRDPEPGDIVVFHAPPGWDDEPGTSPPGNVILRGIRGFGQLIGFVPPDGEVLVKRVIATGGQTVFGNSKGVYVCDHNCAMTAGTSTPPDSYRLLKEPYVFEDGVDAKAAFGPVTVPKGRLWVMGDHRNDSADSRYHCGPTATETATDTNCDPRTSTVANSLVIGKAFVIAWPPSRWRTLGTPPTFDSMADRVVVPSGIPALTLVPLYLLRRRRRR